MIRPAICCFLALAASTANAAESVTVPAAGAAEAASTDAAANVAAGGMVATEPAPLDTSPARGAADGSPDLAMIAVSPAGVPAPEGASGPSPDAAVIPTASGVAMAGADAPAPSPDAVLITASSPGDAPTGGASGPSPDAPAGAAGSAGAAPAPAGPSPDAAPANPAAGTGATGSPSDATATVSPASVASAAMRADEAADGKVSRFGISLGTSLAGGNFGSGQGSRLLSTALGARYATGTLRLTASIPYLNIRSRGLIFSGIDSTPIIVAGGTGGRRVTNDGLGDVTLGAAFTVPEKDGIPEIELSGRVKLPTATRSSQVSTGKTDYSAGVQLTKTFGSLAPFVSATYRIFGDPAHIVGNPAGIDLRNGIAASAGASFTIGERSILLVSYHFAQAASRLIKDSHELFAGASTRWPGSPLRFTAYATAGLSHGAAAESGGLSLSIDF